MVTVHRRFQQNDSSLTLPTKRQYTDAPNKTTVHRRFQQNDSTLTLPTKRQYTDAPKKNRNTLTLPTKRQHYSEYSNSEAVGEYYLSVDLVVHRQQIKIGKLAFKIKLSF